MNLIKYEIMKKNILAITATALAMLVACDKTEFPPKPVNSVVKLENPEDANINFDETSSSKTISFTTKLSWSADFVNSRADDWCTIDPDKGAEGQSFITVNVTANDTPDERNASFVIKSGKASQTIVVTQKPANTIVISSGRMEVEAAGGNYTIVARAQKECTAKVADSAKDWISIVPTKSEESYILISVKANEELAVREGTVTVTCEGASETVTVYQLGVSPSLILTKDKYDLPADGGSFTVEVESNVDVSVSMPSVSWLRENMTKASSTNTYVYTVDPNDTYEDRTASITYSNAEMGLTKTVTVTQAGMKGENSIRILAIGNSFSDDAMEYLWQILKAAGYESIKLGNLYIPSCTLQTHASNITSGSSSYEYRLNTGGTWTNTVSYSSVDALKSDSWDYISMQQGSGSSGMPATYDPYLETLITEVKKLCPDATLMWHMTWAYQANSTHAEFANYDKDQMTMYNAILNTVKDKVLTKPDISFVIPNGTVIQNLRTSLFGDTITRDGYHLSYKVGRFAAALMWAKQITGCDIDAIDWVPPTDIYSGSQLSAIKEAVNNAYAHPYEVTQSEFTEDLDNPNSSIENVMKSAGYNPDDYDKLELDIQTVAYYNSSVDSKINTNMRNYAATRIFTKDEIPNGSVIVQKENHQYRPEGWTALDAKTANRPGNVTAQIVVVDDEWWGDFNFRGFNLAKAGNPQLTDEEQEELKTAFGIFVPKK